MSNTFIVEPFPSTVRIVTCNHSPILLLIAEQFGLVILDNRGIHVVCTWRKKVGEKYTSLMGIRELHDFVTVAMPPDKVVMKVRERCYAGALRDTPTKVKHGFCANESSIPRISNTYKARGLFQTNPRVQGGAFESNV